MIIRHHLLYSSSTVSCTVKACTGCDYVVSKVSQVLGVSRFQRFHWFRGFHGFKGFVGFFLLFGSRCVHASARACHDRLRGFIVTLGLIGLSISIITGCCSSTDVTMGSAPKFDDTRSKGSPIGMYNTTNGRKNSRSEQKEKW